MGCRFVLLVYCFLGLIMTATAPAQVEDSASLKKTIPELSANDRRILQNGEIGGFKRAAGAILAVYPGFGIGHAVQGRYAHRGWIFTLSEAGSLAVAASGLAGCSSAYGDCSAVYLGLAGFLGFRIWEFVDSIVGPIRDNRQFRKLQSDARIPDAGIVMQPLLKVEDGQRIFGLGITWSLN